MDISYERRDLCPDCLERMGRPYGRHAAGCGSGAGPAPVGVWYRVTAPDGKVLRGRGRHREHRFALMCQRVGEGWGLISDHTSWLAAEKAVLAGTAETVLAGTAEILYIDGGHRGTAVKRRRWIPEPEQFDILQDGDRWVVRHDGHPQCRRLADRAAAADEIRRMCDLVDVPPVFRDPSNPDRWTPMVPASFRHTPIKSSHLPDREDFDVVAEGGRYVVRHNTCPVMDTADSVDAARYIGYICDLRFTPPLFKDKSVPGRWTC